MKTTDLIRALQAADPDGNMNVVIGNVDIKNVSLVHGADRGWYQQIEGERNTRGTIARITGAKYIGDGHKVVISTHSLSEILKSYPNLKVDIVGEDPSKYKHQLVDNWRPQKVSQDELAATIPYIAQDPTAYFAAIAPPAPIAEQQEPAEYDEDPDDEDDDFDEDNDDDQPL